MLLPDHQHALAEEVRGTGVVDRVQLLPDEGLHAGDVREERMRPRARRVHEGAGGPLPLPGAHDEETVAILDAIDLHGPDHRQRMLLLVGVEVRRHRDVRTLVVARWSDVIRELRDSVHVAHRQRVPAVLPRTPGAVARVQEDV